MCLNPRVEYCDRKYFQRLPNVQRMLPRRFTRAHVFIRSSLTSTVLLSFSALSHTRHNPFGTSWEVQKKKIKRANQNTQKTPQYNSISRLNADWHINAIMSQRWSSLHIRCVSIFQQYFALNITVDYTCQPKTGGFVSLGFPPCLQWSKYLFYNNLYNWLLVTQPASLG